MSSTQTETKQALLTELATEVEKLATSDGWLHWLDIGARFRTYSLRNQLLIACQRPEASRVASYRTWQQINRQVRAGEKGIAIFAPLLKRQTNDEVATAPVADTAPKQLMGFRLVHVFDISQTDGEPLPIPQMPDVEADGDQPLHRLLSAARSQNLTVDFIDGEHHGKKGWYSRTERHITIVNGYSIASQTRTLLHELAHACDTLEGTRAECELVAESAAFLVGNSIDGLAMRDASVFYAASWGGSTQRFQELAERTVAVAHQIEKILG